MDIETFTQLGASGTAVGLLLWWCIQLRGDLKEARADLLRCQAEKEDIMQDYMHKPHEVV